LAARKQTERQEGARDRIHFKGMLPSDQLPAARPYLPMFPPPK
jgi:hypothetical protein